MKVLTKVTETRETELTSEVEVQKTKNSINLYVDRWNFCIPIKSYVIGECWEVLFPNNEWGYVSVRKDELYVFLETPDYSQETVISRKELGI